MSVPAGIDRHRHRADVPVRVLFVCSGNICRSPLGAQILTVRLGRDLPAFVVESAGTIARGGMPMDADAAAQSSRLGGNPSAHRSRYLTESIVSGADLVLTAEREHRTAAVSLAPRATKRVFTIREFARVLDALEPSALQDIATPQNLVEHVARLRGAISAPVDPAADDVDDPYRRSADLHHRVADEIATAVATIADALRAVR